MTNSDYVGDLELPDEALFEFVPHGGFRYIGDGKSILICSSGTAKGLTDSQLVEYARAGQELEDSYASSGYVNQNASSSRVLREKDFRSYESKYIYKFVTVDTYERYILNGEFLLSSLDRFRRLEHNKNSAGDRFEGLSTCSYHVRDSQYVFKTISGYHTFVFSSTRDLQMAMQMQKMFGDVVLRITLSPFRTALTKQLECTKSETKLVRYADYKIFKSRIRQKDLGKYPQTLCPVLAVTLRNGSRLPTLFAKPERFALEREVRLAFEMPSDVSDTISITLPNSSAYVERIFV